MKSSRALRVFALAAALSTILAACGGGDSGGQSPPAQAGTIGAAGGTVTSPEGASVAIPAGALSSDVAIAITKSSSIAPALPQIPDVQPAGDFFDLTPHNTTFAVPVTLTVPFDPARVPAGATVMLLKPNAAQTGWVPVPGATVSGATISGTISNFADPGPVAVSPPDINQQPTDQTVAIGQSATFGVIATGHFGPAPLLYAWESSADHGATWTTIAGANAATYTTPSTVAADNGKQFRVTVSLQALPFVNVVSAAAQIIIPTAPPPPGATPMIAAGVHHTLALKADGTVWAWGRNDLGQLGNHSNTMSPVPVQPVGLPATSKVAVGHYHSLALAVDGSVWQWGGTQNVPSVPAAVALSGRFVDIAEGDFFSVALRDDGTVWSWGAAGNNNGVPAQVIGLASISAISAGTNHALALKGDGTVQMWSPGGNAPITITDPAGTGTLTGVQWIRAIDGQSLALAVNGAQSTIYTWGNGLGQFGFPSVNPIAATALQPYVSVSPASYAIAIGRGTTVSAFLLAIDGANGNALKGLGSNLDGELGIGSTVDATTATPLPGMLDVRQVDATHVSLATYAVARKGDGTVWAWGNNGTGQLGDGTTTNRLVPVQVQGLNLN
jgi:alpha-tubulin suppressor-like RCC1 family protein